MTSKDLKTILDSLAIDPDDKSVTRKDLKYLWGFVIGIAVVVGLGFITLLIQYFTATQTTFQNLNNQVLIQNGKLELLYYEIHRQKGFR